MPKTTAPAASRRLAASERRRQILDTARGLLEAGTPEEISVESVARHAGVSPGLLFHYFGSQRAQQVGHRAFAATQSASESYAQHGFKAPAAF